MIEIPFDPADTGYVFACDLVANGEVGEAWMLLDTGASTTMISRDLAMELAVDWSAITRFAEFDSATQAERAPVVTLAWMNIEGAQQDDVDAIVHDLPARLMLDGVIGLNFLRRFRSVALDFESGVLVIEP